MAGEGSAALGAPELAGAMVNPRGFGKKASVGAIGGAVGALAATAVASRSKASDVPAFGRVGYLAASETEVALIKTKSGALKMKVTEGRSAGPRLPRGTPDGRTQGWQAVLVPPVPVRQWNRLGVRRAEGRQEERQAAGGSAGRQRHLIGPASRTSVALTHRGRAALDAYTATLRGLLDGPLRGDGGVV
jgi:hypothetical protein